MTRPATCSPRPTPWSRTGLAAAINTGSGFVDDFENAYTYDNLQRLTRIPQTSQSGGNAVAEKRVDFAYNSAGQFTDIDRYDDLAGGSADLIAATDFVFDQMGQLTDLTHLEDTTTFADYDWDYDQHSRVLDFAFASLAGGSGSSSYTYDDTNQLTAADHDYQTDESYEYDENGNRTMSGYSTGDNNLTLSDGTYNYQYDDEGNRTKKTTIATDAYADYTWDHRNRLEQIDFRDSSDELLKRVQYEYDMFNWLISKAVNDDGDEAIDRRERYVYDESGKRDVNTAVALDDVIIIFDGNGSLTARFLHGPMIDQILAAEDSAGRVLWHLGDNLGTIRDLVERETGTGVVVVANHLDRVRSA